MDEGLICGCAYASMTGSDFSVSVNSSAQKGRDFEEVFGGLFLYLYVYYSISCLLS